MYHGLTLLKGLAAFGIVGCHLFLAPMTPCAERLLWFCDLNVALFGAVSGFLLLMSFDRKAKASDFSVWQLIAHRARRILPVYFFWTCVFLVTSPILDVFIRHGAINARYWTISFWCSALLRGGSSTHLWYLSHLFWWSLLLYGLWGCSRRVFSHPVFLVALSAVTLAVCVWLRTNFCAYGLRLLVFMSLGAALYRSQLKFDQLAVHWLLCALVVALGIHLYCPLHAYVRDFIVTMTALPLFARNYWPASRLGNVLGANSFGVYLVHPLLTMALSMGVKGAWGTPVTATILILDWIAVCVLASVFAWSMRAHRLTRWTVT